MQKKGENHQWPTLFWGLGLGVILGFRVLSLGFRAPVLQDLYPKKEDYTANRPPHNPLDGASNDNP